MIKIKRIRKVIGDIIEIPTSKGLAYVQYIYEHKAPPHAGSLVRILEGFYETRPSENELQELVKKPHRFSTFCPVHHAINMGIFEHVGNFPVPEFARKFPVFKNGLVDPTSKKVSVWWLWDGEKSWKAGTLSEEEQEKYPNLVILTATSLVHAIETGKTAQGIKHC